MSKIQPQTEKTHRFVTMICGNCGDEIQPELECGDRTCEHCFRKRKGRIINNLMGPVTEMSNPKFLTLTVVSRPLTLRNVRYLRKCFTKLRHRKLFDGVKGGFYNIELGNLNKNGVCNMHIHCIYDGPYIPQAEISCQWNQITGDSYIVFIENCYDAQGAMRYITKHFCKLGNFYPEQKDLINSYLKRTRMIQGFGSIRIAKPEKITICKNCGAENSFYSHFDPLFYDVVSAFDGLEYTQPPAIAIPI